MIRGIVTLGFAVLVVVAVPVAGADVVVDGTEVTATTDDGTTTAEVTLINTGASAVPLTPAALGASSCTVTAAPTTLPALASTDVTLTLRGTGCLPESASVLEVDVDGAGKAPLVRVSAEDEQTDWAPLWWGLFVGVLMAGTVGLRGWTEHQETQEEIVGSRGGRAKRRKAYRAVQRVVSARMTGLTTAQLNWKKLKAPTYGLTSTIGNLEAGWSFKDSWVANLTVASTALLTLLTSSDTLTTVLGEEPAAALGVMTVAALVSAALIGVANTVVKLVGPSVSVVTVGGLIASTSLVVLAAGFQVVTVGLSVAGAAGSWPLAGGALLLALLVGAVLEVYAFRSLGQTIREGFADSLPVVPADAVSAWAATDAWEKAVVEAQIRATYGNWLQKDRSRPGRGSVPGMADWAPVTPPPAPEPRRRSLL